MLCWHFTPPRIMFSISAPFGAVLRFSKPSAVIRTSSSILAPSMCMYLCSTSLSMTDANVGLGRKRLSDVGAEKSGNISLVYKGFRVKPLTYIFQARRWGPCSPPGALSSTTLVHRTLRHGLVKTHREITWGNVREFLSVSMPYLLFAFFLT